MYKNNDKWIQLCNLLNDKRKRPPGKIHQSGRQMSKQIKANFIKIIAAGHF